MEPGGTLVVEVRGPLTPCQADGLRDQALADLSAASPALVRCDVTGRADLAVVAVLAWLVLQARRSGVRVTIHCLGDELPSLLLLTGLHDAVRDSLEVVGQPEAREQRGVEEVVQVDDLPA